MPVFGVWVINSQPRCPTFVDTRRRIGLQISLSDTSATVAEALYGCAYNETLGAAIAAGQTTNDPEPSDPSTAPEPPTLALFALGALGLLAFRKRLA
ncbi:MAG: PEP-CTERM sorting domain-containing protein [Terriglobales bacterium]